MGQPESKPVDEGSDSVGSHAAALHSASGYCSIGKVKDWCQKECSVLSPPARKCCSWSTNKQLGHVLNHVMKQLYPSCDTGQHLSCSNKQKYKSLLGNKIKPLIFCWRQDLPKTPEITDLNNKLSLNTEKVLYARV